MNVGNFDLVPHGLKMHYGAKVSKKKKNKEEIKTTLKKKSTKKYQKRNQLRKLPEIN